MTDLIPPASGLHFGTNWKTRVPVVPVADWIAQVENGLSRMPVAPRTFVLPTALLCAELASLSRRVEIGVQNFVDGEAEVLTGELPVGLIQRLGMNLAMVGHAERRTVFGESDQDIAAKVTVARRLGLDLVLCVGESAAERAESATASVLRHQLTRALSNLDLTVPGSISIGYEPVWAIGDSGVSAPVDEIADAVGQIRSVLSELGLNGKVSTPVIYGGSVSRRNAEEIMASTSVDGLFIGRAAYHPENFLDIISLATSAREANPVSSDLKQRM